MHLKDIIDRCGGPDAIERASTVAGRHIAAKSVYNWARVGIPEKHWPVVMKLSGCTTDQLHRANERIRRAREGVAA